MLLGKKMWKFIKQLTLDNLNIQKIGQVDYVETTEIVKSVEIFPFAPKPNIHFAL